MRFLFVFFTVFVLFNLRSQEDEKFLIDTVAIVPFSFDSFSVPDSLLSHFKTVFKDFSGEKVYVDGYTDTIGTISYNLKLADKRSQSVVAILSSLGIADSLIVSTSKGILRNKKSEDSRVAVVYVKNSYQKVIPLKVAKVEISDWEKAKIEREKILQAELEERELAAQKKKEQLREELTKGEVITIDGIEFVPGESTLMDYSKPALVSLLDLLADNPDLKIEIQGHICCSKQYEGFDKKTGKYNLSEMRAKSVYDILVKNGIGRSRLSYKGYGNSRPLFPEDSPENMQRNRRVSIQVVTE